MDDEKQVLNEEELSSVTGVPAMMNIRDQDDVNKDDPWNQH